MTRLKLALLPVVAILSFPAYGNSADRANYLLHCAGCHGEDGRGLPGHVPSMRGVVSALAASPEGRRYVLGVPGVTQSELTSEQMASVLNWIVREFREPGFAGATKPFTPAEVTRGRQAPILQVTATRERLVQRLPPALR